MQEYEEYMYDDFIIYNFELGIRDFVNIGEIDTSNYTAYLDEPYEMVGPFCLDELFSIGKISFEACVVMSEQYWKDNRAFIQEESIRKQKKLQDELYKEINKNNQRRKCKSQKEYRDLLFLPQDVSLDISQIKTAYRKVVKKVHPDVGGCHEKFILITEARDILLKSVA